MVMPPDMRPLMQDNIAVFLLREPRRNVDFRPGVILLRHGPPASGGCGWKQSPYAEASFPMLHLVNNTVLVFVQFIGRNSGAPCHTVFLEGQ